MTTQDERLAEATEIIAEGIEIYDRLQAIIRALRSEMLVAASRIRAYQSPAYDDRHDYQQPGTLERARAGLMSAYNESAELLARVEMSK